MTNERLSAADFFAGIGGIRLGFEQSGFKVIYASEIDPKCCDIYEQNFNEKPFGDINSIDLNSIPEFDVFLGGFPCQPFSLAGKRNGFDDTRADVIHGIERVLKGKNPKAFFLENVKHFVHIKDGKVFETFKEMLEGCGYNVFTKTLNAKHFGVPQNRERLYLVGFRKDLGITSFNFPEGNGQNKTIGEFLEKKVSLEYYLSKKLLRCLQRHRARHSRMGNGFGYFVLDRTDIANTLVCGNMGRERNLVKDDYSIFANKDSSIIRKKNRLNLRYLTPREYARLQGFPGTFRLYPYKTRAYKQIANSVAIPVITAISNEMANKLKNL